MSAYKSTKKPAYDAFISVMDAAYIQPGMIIASGDLSEKNDWVAVAISQEIDTARKMVVELEHIATGRKAVSKISPDEIVERKIYRDSLHAPVQAKDSVVE